MPEITFDESVRETDRLGRKARDAAKAGDFPTAIRTWQELLAHPCAHHQVVAYEIWDEIHHVHRRAGEYDAAIDAKKTAIEAGYRSEPDAEADIAECHLLAGRRDEADRIFTELRARTPDDVWLYNAAGFSYAHARDHREAERWLRDGIAVAFRTGDPDQVVMQLLDLLDDSLRALGQPPDAELTREVEAFCEAWEPVEKPRTWGDLPFEEERSCGYCGFEPARSDTEMNERARRNRERVLGLEAPEVLARLEALPGREPPRARLQPEASLSVAWFPAGEWETAVERWPDLLDELPREHVAYSHEIEARVKRIARHIPGQPLHVSPLTVDGLVADAAARHDDPGTKEARAAYAAEVMRIGAAPAWPPGRNEPCWCGSGRKYKQCCGPVPPAPAE